MYCNVAKKQNILCFDYFFYIPFRPVNSSKHHFWAVILMLYHSTTNLWKPEPENVSTCENYIWRNYCRPRDHRGKQITDPSKTTVKNSKISRNNKMGSSGSNAETALALSAVAAAESLNHQKYNLRWWVGFWSLQLIPKR